MATYTKTVQTPLISLQSVAASSVVSSSAFDVSTKLGGIIQVRFGRRSATAATAGVNIRLELSHTGSTDNSWYPFATLTTAFAACEAEAVSGSCLAGTPVIRVASTTNLTAGDVIFVDNSTIANSEWGRVKAISTNASVTLEDALVSTQTGATLYDSAEIYAPIAIPEGAIRIRAVIDGSSFTQAFAIQVTLSTIDSIS